MTMDRLLDLFAKQFTETADGWVFRARQTGPAIAVTRQERDLFVTGFNKSARRNFRLCGQLMLIFTVIAFGAIVAAPERLPRGFDSAFLGVLVLIVCVACLQSGAALRFPEMALASRPHLSPAVAPRSRALWLSKDYWLALWAAPALGLALSINTVTYHARSPEPWDKFMLFWLGLLLTIWLVIKLNPRYFASKPAAHH
jgi:hypothetical protein